MSRFYTMELEIKPVKESEKGKVFSFLRRQGAERKDYRFEDNKIITTCDISLCAGQTEAQKHAEMKKDRFMAERSMVSRWLCWDYHEWDDTIWDDDWEVRQ